MLYRVSQAAESGFADAAEEFEAMRDHAQEMMTTADQNDIMDTLVMLANVCEFRALSAPTTPEQAIWWSNAAALARAMLHMLNGPRAAPNAKLENPMLYFPDVDGES
jgi:hypothetical protein